MLGVAAIPTAFLLGLGGSLHCLGMCGPLMLVAGRGGTPQLLAYQAGRLLVYALLGFLLGTLGWGARLGNVQGELSLLSGVLLLFVALGRTDLLSPAGRLQLWLRQRMGKLLGGGGVGRRFALGCCNGLLPCGLVYAAVIGAANTEGPVAGAGFMLAFGAGTLPLLLITLTAGTRLFRITGGRVQALLTSLAVLAGLLLIWRGWRFVAPFEFQVFRDMAFPTMCH